MTISAKFASVCTSCRGRVAVGDRVEWQRGERGVRHTACAGPAQAPPVQAPPAQAPSASASSISYAKLKDGSWGVRGPVALIVDGASVVVHKRDGKTQNETIAQVLWSGDGVAVAAVVVRSPRVQRNGEGNGARRRGGGCHTDGNCSSMCSPTGGCPCADGGWFRCC